MDQACHEALARAQLPGLRPIALADFERGDEALLRAKENRTLIEYYFTCTASLPRYVFREEPAIDLLTYLDADLYFFADPDPLFGELGGGSVGIIEHRSSKRLGSLEEYGRYNVAWISFRRDANGMACLEWWRDRCLEWCYDRVERAVRGASTSTVATAVRGSWSFNIRCNVAPWSIEDHPVRWDEAAQWGRARSCSSIPRPAPRWAPLRSQPGAIRDEALESGAPSSIIRTSALSMRPTGTCASPGHFAADERAQSAARPVPQRAVKRIRRLGFWIELASGHYLLAPLAQASRLKLCFSARAKLRRWSRRSARWR
jgi:hypothetical protein